MLHLFNPQEGLMSSILCNKCQQLLTFLWYSHVCSYALGLLVLLDARILGFVVENVKLDLM